MAAFQSQRLKCYRKLAASDQLTMESFRSVINGGSPCVTAVRTEGGEGGVSQIFSQPVPIRGGLVT